MLDLILTFLKIGTFTFGGGTVMIAFLEQDAVNHFGWVTRDEYIAAVAMGQMTPGPFSVTSVFIGYKVAGFIGAIAAMTAICLPSFFMTVAASWNLPRLKSNLRVRAFLRGVSPAVVGMILAAGMSIARSSIVDIWTALIAAVCLVALLRFKVDTAVVILIAGVSGLLLP